MERNERGLEAIAQELRRAYEEDVRSRKVICRTHIDPYRDSIFWWKIPGCGDCSTCTPNSVENERCSRYTPVTWYGEL
jgi:hypothetical protein